MGIAVTEASYTAWDDNLYEWPPPDGWYQASDGKWWPDGYGPTSQVEVRVDGGGEATNGAGQGQEAFPVSVAPVDGAIGEMPPAVEPGEHDPGGSPRVYDEPPNIDDVFGGIDPFAEDEDEDDVGDDDAGDDVGDAGGTDGGDQHEVRSVEPPADIDDLLPPDAEPQDEPDLDSYPTAARPPDLPAARPPDLPADLPADLPLDLPADLPADLPLDLPADQPLAMAPAEVYPEDLHHDDPGDGPVDHEGHLDGYGGAALDGSELDFDPGPALTGQHDRDSLIDEGLEPAIEPVSPFGDPAPAPDLTGDLGPPPSTSAISGFGTASPTVSGDHPGAAEYGSDQHYDQQRQRTSTPLIMAALCGVGLLAAVLFFVFRGGDDDPVVAEEGTEAATQVAAGPGSLEQPYELRTGVVVFYEGEGDEIERRWVVQVLSPVADGTAELVAAGAPPPPEGEILAFTRVRITYQAGPAPGDRSDLILGAVGDSGASYTERTHGCGTVGEALAEAASLQQTESVEGNVCWRIGAFDLGTLKLTVQAGPAVGTVHFALS